MVQRDRDHATLQKKLFRSITLSLALYSYLYYIYLADIPSTALPFDCS